MRLTRTKEVQSRLLGGVSSLLSGLGGVEAQGIREVLFPM